jgi:hypothetical protein
MDDNLKAAVLMARAASLQAEVAGMIAANIEQESQGYALAYDEKAFFNAIDSNGLGENGITKVALHGDLS